MPGGLENWEQISLQMIDPQMVLAGENGLAELANLGHSAGVLLMIPQFS